MCVLNATDVYFKSMSYAFKKYIEGNNISRDLVFYLSGCYKETRDENDYDIQFDNQI